MRSLHRYPDQTALDIRGGQRRLEALREPSPLAAIVPELVADELALERWLGVASAAAGAGVAVASLAPWPHLVERHYGRAAGTLHAAAHAGTPSPAAAQPVRTSSSAGWP